MCKRLDLMQEIIYITITKPSPSLLNAEEFAYLKQFSTEHNLPFKFYDNINIIADKNYYTGIAVENQDFPLPNNLTYKTLSKGVYIFNQFTLEKTTQIEEKLTIIEKKVENYLKLINITKKDNNKFLRMVIEPHGKSYQLFIKVGELGEY